MDFIFALGDQTLELPKLEEDESIFSAIGLDPGE